MDILKAASGIDVKAVLIGVGILVVVGILGFAAYQFDRQIELRVAAEKNVVTADEKAKVAEANRDGLKAALDGVIEQMRRLDEENAKLEADVERSKGAVADLRVKLAKEREKQRSTPVPDGSDEQIKWLRKRVEELKEEYAR